MPANSLEKETSEKSTMEKVGYHRIVKIADTLQGRIYRCQQKSNGKSVVIKATDRNLHENSIVHIGGNRVKVHENVKTEKTILRHLSKDDECPDSIVKYVASFKTQSTYFIAMEDGGLSLFDFVVKSHKCIESGMLDVTEWHKLVKIIFKQMVDCIEYIHCKNICHFDISLENWLINEDLLVAFGENNKIKFVLDSVQIKLCDFGLSEMFSNRNNFASNKYCGKSNYQSPEISSHKADFCAISNDVWCLGVCLFMMIIGVAPWRNTTNADQTFNCFMNGKIVKVLRAWNRMKYANQHLIELFSAFFQYEESRVNISSLKRCRWFIDG